MLKPYLLFALICTVICSSNCYANSYTTHSFNSSYRNFQHISITFPKDSLAKKKIDSLTKALAAQKDKEKTILQKLVQPFKFKANRKAYVNTSIHDYIVADSIQAVKQLANLTTSVSRIQNSVVDSDKTTKYKLAKLQQSISDVKTQLLQEIAAISKATQPVNPPAPIDTPVKERNQAPVIPNSNTSQVPNPADVKAEQAKLNILRLLYKGPIRIHDTLKKKDTVLLKDLSLGHYGKVFGFYSDTSHASLKRFNFKTITDFVYVVNPLDKDNTEEAIATHKAIIDSALQAGCNVSLAMYIDRPESISALLMSTNTTNTVIKNMVGFLIKGKASGININFKGMTPNMYAPFVIFIGQLYKVCQAAPQKFKICITVPADDKGVTYDLPALNRYVTNFIIDFSEHPKKAGPLEPLNNGSNNSVETCMSLYLNEGIDASKFILGVSYSGVVWQNAPSRFMHYITYNEVRANYSDTTVSYTVGESAAHIEAPYGRNYLNVWYDNEITLGEKYDFVIKNALGGVAIKSLGDDNAYGELQNVLAYKLLKVDTTIVGTVIIKHTFITTLTTIIDLLTQNPCDQEVPPIFKECLVIINLCFILLIAVSAGVLYYNVRKYSESWKWRKPLIYILLGLFIVWSFFLLMWLFFSSNFPYFGPSHKFETDCVTVPFIVLYLVLTTGIGLGILTWWLYKLNNEDDVP